jgi:hypothetical protein
MKDAIHHLKHVQKKVIQSTRKAEALESEKSLPNGSPVNAASTSMMERPSPNKRKDANRQLNKSFIRVNVH